MTVECKVTDTVPVERNEKTRVFPDTVVRPFHAAAWNGLKPVSPPDIP